MLNNRLAHWIPRLTPQHAGLHLAKLRGSPEAIRNFPPRVADGVIDAFAHSLSTVFWCLVPVAIVWLVLALLLPERPLRGDDAEQIEMLDDTGLAAIAVTDGHLVV